MANENPGDCCVNGIIEIYVDGYSVPIKADAEVILRGPYEYEASSTMTGELVLSAKLHPVELEFTSIRSCEGDISLLTQKCSLNVSIREPGRRQTHRMTKAHISGRPDINLTSGEISGLMIVCGNANYSTSAYT